MSKVNSSFSPPLADTIEQNAKILTKVIKGASLNSLLESNTSNKPISPASRHWLFEVLRQYAVLEDSINSILIKPKNRKFDKYIYSILLLAIAMFNSNRHQSIVVNEAVKVAKKIKSTIPNPGGLVNAVLREYLRKQKNNRNSKISQFSADEIKFWHPNWWIKILKAEYPDDYLSIIKANNSHPPMNIRVNINRSSIENLTEKLKNFKIDCRPIKSINFFEYESQKSEKNVVNYSNYWASMQVKPEFSVLDNQSFRSGEFSIQDTAATWAISLLNIKDHQFILDACAAPGGKSCHLGEFCSFHKYQTKIISLEIDQKRAEKIEENKKRLQLKNIKIITGDICKPNYWRKKLSKNLFDRILLDVPCSGSATVRRHPDGKWHLRETDLIKYHYQQLEIINSAWNLLKPNGIIIYSTCSSFSIENEQVIINFINSLQKKPMFKPQNIGKSNHEGKYQIYQTILNLVNIKMKYLELNVAKIIPNQYHDGHFYASLRKL